MENPKVSVIIPAYNAEMFIVQCVQSVQSQSLDDIEIIVVDDGSTDSTAELVKQLALQDDRITLIEQENSFAGVARNNGMANARGEYFYFLDADDYVDAQLLSQMVSRIEATEADVVVCDAWRRFDETDETQPADSLWVVDRDKVYTRDELVGLVFRYCNGWPWDKLFRADFIKEHDLKYQSLRTTNDAYFVFMALMLARRTAFVDEKLVYHRENIGTSLCATRRKSYDNAVKAAMFIKQGMQEAGLYKMFAQDYINWISNFFIWNFESLEPTSCSAFLKILRDEVVPILPLDDPDYFYNSWEYKTWKAFASEPIDVLRDYLNEARNYSALVYEHNVLNDTVNRQDKRIAALEKELEDIKTARYWAEVKRDELQNELQELLESKTYRAGEAITFVPRKLKGLKK